MFERCKGSAPAWAGLLGIAAASVSLPASAALMLTFSVADVRETLCSGLVQPVCSVSAVGPFSEQFMFDPVRLSATDNSAPPFYSSDAFFNFPALGGGTPYTAALMNRVTGPITLAESFTQLTNDYDLAAGAGQAGALFNTLQASDTTNAAAGLRTQQEYFKQYNLFAALTRLPDYFDLTAASAMDFFSAHSGSLTGSFDERGAASVFDAGTLGFTQYDFTEYTGTATLFSVTQIPEPGGLGLAGLGLLLGWASMRRPINPTAAGAAQGEA